MPPSGDRYRLLLDQNFPKPPGFELGAVDQNVEAIHLWDHNRGLAEPDTPDWLIYLHAAKDCFDAIVTRDASQSTLPEEMWVLTRVRLTIVTFRRAIEDPIVEWGQLLAFMPQLRRLRRARRGASRFVYLPKPALSTDAAQSASKLFETVARDLGVDAKELRQSIAAEVWAELNERSAPELLPLLKWRPAD